MICIHSFLLLFLHFFNSFVVPQHAERREWLYTEERCVMNTTIPEFTYTHIHSFRVNDWQFLSTEFFLFLMHFLFFFCIVPDHELESDDSWHYWLNIYICIQQAMDDKTSSTYPIHVAKSNKYVIFFFNLMLFLC